MCGGLGAWWVGLGHGGLGGPRGGEQQQGAGGWDQPRPQCAGWGRCEVAARLLLEIVFVTARLKLGC